MRHNACLFYFVEFHKQKKIHGKKNEKQTIFLFFCLYRTMKENVLLCMRNLAPENRSLATQTIESDAQLINSILNDFTRETHKKKRNRIDET